jgi:hypothetical protein
MEKPTIKDKAVLAYVEHLELQLSNILSSPYYNTYVTIKGQIDSFNEQLTIKEPTKVKVFVGDVLEEVNITPGKIDLFADKDSKEFDRAWKYLLESVDLSKKLDELRKLLTPDEAKKAEKLLKDKNIGLAEQIALKNANG